jgi:Tetrapyrrole (Corrin/Porphyrin) Methylases
MCVQTAPGITAMQDLASRAGISLAEGTEPVTLVPLNGGLGALDLALAAGGTVVVYKVGAAASPAPDVLRDRLHAAGRLDGAVIGARLGLPGELIAPAAQVLPPLGPPAPEAPAPAPEAPAPAPEAPAAAPEAPAAPPPGGIPYLSTVIVPAARRAGTGSSLSPAVTAETEEPQAPDGKRNGPPASHVDGPAVSPGPPQWTSGVVTPGAEATREDT